MITDYIIKRPWHEAIQITPNMFFDAYSKKGLLDRSAIEIVFKPFFAIKEWPLDFTMLQFYEATKKDMHFFTLESNAFEIVDINYKTFPDIPVLQSVHMSCAIPMVISPVCFDDKCFVDGGILNNYPIKYCVENEKNVEEIFGIQNMYEKKENNIVKNESTMLDYVIHFVSRLVNFASDQITSEIVIPYELKYDAYLMSLDNMKEALHSGEVRKGLIDKGIAAAEEFLSKLKESNEETIEKTEEETEVISEN
jgi:predicted acylesterase/phospholipase RssA